MLHSSCALVKRFLWSFLLNSKEYLISLFDNMRKTPGAFVWILIYSISRVPNPRPAGHIMWKIILNSPSKLLLKYKLNWKISLNYPPRIKSIKNFLCIIYFILNKSQNEMYHVHVYKSNGFPYYVSFIWDRIKIHYLSRLWRFSFGSKYVREKVFQTFIM